LTQHIDPTDHLVTRDDGIAFSWQFPVDDMQVGSTYAAGAYLDADLAGPGIRIGALYRCQCRAGRLKYHGIHGDFLSAICGEQVWRPGTRTD
jgi:hypothetical protein